MFPVALSIPAAWLAAAAANWAADALPACGQPDRQNPGARTPFWRYLLPGWRAERAAGPADAEATSAPRAARPAGRALAVQAAMVLLFICGWWRFQATPAVLVVAWLYTVYLLATLVIDFETSRVLNVMLGPAAVIVLALSFLPGMPGPLAALLGGAAGFGGFLVLFLIGRGRAMGFGDVKLAWLIGLMLGYPAVVPALALGIVLGGLAALALLIARKAGRKSYIAYAPYLCLGALVVLFRLLQS